MATLNTRIVLRNDLAENWLINDPVLLAGETGVETDTGYFKIGNGTSKWSELTYANKFESTPVAAHYEVPAAEGQSDNDAINTALSEANAVAKLDDIAIVKRLISNDKYQYTAFVFNGNAWTAMSNDYNAENVYFDENITITTAVGNVGLTNGSGEIPAAGKNLKQVFEALWTKENYKPTVTNPSIKLSLNKTSASGEVGTTFEAPTATAEISGFGSFQFGSQDSTGKFYAPDAASDVEFSTLKVGVAATAAALTDDASASISNVGSGATTKKVSYTGAAGTFTSSAQTQQFSASAAHGGSARKGVSNLGNLVNTAGTGVATDFASAGKGIAANAGTMAINGSSNNNYKFTATGYYAWFAGGVDTIPSASELTGAWIREHLENKGKYSPLGTKASGAKPTLQITPGPDGDKSYIIAVPGTAKEYLSLVELSSSLYMDITADYTANKFTVKVPDAAGVDSTVSYTVYWYKPAALGADETHDIYMV